MPVDMENLRPEDRRLMRRANRELKVVLGMTYYPNDMTLEEKAFRLMHYRQTLSKLDAAGLRSTAAS